MCLAIPGQVKSITSLDGSRKAKVSFGGIIKDVYLDMVPEADIGDYVLVHVGVALATVNEKEALLTFKYLKEAGELEEIKPTEDEISE